MRGLFPTEERSKRRIINRSLPVLTSLRYGHGGCPVGYSYTTFNNMSAKSINFFCFFRLLDHHSRGRFIAALMQRINLSVRARRNVGIVGEEFHVIPGRCHLRRHLFRPRRASEVFGNIKDILVALESIERHCA
jgi:hypothetical protein